MNNKAIYSLIAINVLLIVTLLYSFNQKSNTNECIKQVVSFTCPKKDFVFAGQKIPMDDPEVYERMERELLVNTYWQSSTLLTLRLAELYFPTFERILKEYGVPDDFKYLAVAESGLRDVVSPAGASGKWQFMKETARQYGLVVNDEIDERYHLEKSTVAACKYLLSARNTLGSWANVAGGYNMGVAGIAKKMNEQRNDNYYNLWLNPETSRYVFRIMAFKEIHQNPENYGYIIDKSIQPPTHKTKKVTLLLPNYDLTAYAISQGTNYKTLRYLNPWIRSNQITTLKDSVELLMPI